MKDKSCLVVVDMINGFVKEGALSDQSIQRIIPSVKSLIEKYIKEDGTIISFQDAHEEDAQEFNTFPIHCVKGSIESDLIEELKPYEKEMIPLYKNSTNGFMQPEFLGLFQRLDCNDYVIVGCCTDICVLQFALSLQGYINEHNLNCRVKVVEDAVETFNTDVHNQASCNANAFQLLKSAGIALVKTKEIL
ncbi:MAG: cysteine hydrolase family protein [Anaerorhabdus sp.]